MSVLQLELGVLRLVALCGDDGSERYGNLGLRSGSPFGFGHCELKICVLGSVSQCLLVLGAILCQGFSVSGSVMEHHALLGWVCATVSMLWMSHLA